jgi:predicted alpha/beta-hydrolase family hydrolase
VLVCYPLHPPGKPENLRVDHFPQLDVPCLFISGTRDPFGSPEEFDRHLPAIPGDVTVHRIEGKGHDLKGAEPEITDTVVAWLGALT